MKAERIFETILYADDLKQAKWFYSDVLGMSLQSEGELFSAFRMPQSVLLIFDPSLSQEPGRSVPSHGATGDGHIAFAAGADEVQGWIAHFEEKSVEESGISSIMRMILSLQLFPCLEWLKPRK